MFTAIEVVREIAFIIDRKLHIRTMSASAERLLAAKDGLISRNGQIVAATPEATGRLHAAIREKFSEGGGLSEAGYLTLPRNGGKHPLSVSIRLLGQSDTGEPHAVLFVKDPCLNPRLNQSQLIDIFSLTPSEANLALHLAKGGSLQEYSQNSGLSMNTVRTHLKHVFNKTYTRRQPELVSLLLRSAHTHEPE